MQDSLSASAATSASFPTVQVAILVFGLLTLGLEIWVLIRKNQGFGPQAVRIVGVTLILVVALFLATSPTASTRFSEMLGLLGTLAGYLVGRSDSAEQATTARNGSQPKGT